ncbi:hypothetical protein [Croceicoccus ponticola]|uniref:hypothetical protein n=1 Tax=Croceicoccus ponticola TaxID=2217664 RepID=UPI000FD6EA57|nr:hypothetical protein [Croceicoccus ponticola]
MSGVWIVYRASSAQSANEGGLVDPDVVRDSAFDDAGPDAQGGCVAQAGVLCVMVGLLILALTLAAD